jgi:LPPG:FO 2-phospho-L-lactate transferase
MPSNSNTDSQYAVLSGGVGGSKLVLGLQAILAENQLTVIANTGDDFEHLGLPICPDLDTLMYTLSGQVNPDTGWGLQNESWEFMAALEDLNGAAWFRLGDRDLRTHVHRRDLLNQGQPLSEATSALLQQAGIATRIWPMSNMPVRTKIKTSDNTYDFQDYFVRLQAEPAAEAISYEGSDVALACPEALAALSSDQLAAILITPSNPWLSIDPILSLNDIKSAIMKSKLPVVGVSPIVGGQAIKGPTAKLMQEFGLDVSAYSIAEHYRDILDGIIIDQLDIDQQPAIEALGLKVEISNTIMHTLEDKKSLADVALRFAASLRSDCA